MMNWKQKILALLKSRALLLGDFTLSSGQKSSYYIDLRLLSLYPEGAYYLAKVILEMIAGEEVDAIGGPTLGADPILGAIAAISFLENRPLSTFIVRKESKSHGTEKLIEGELKADSKVIIIDDVITTGKSTLRAIQAAEEFHCHIVRVIAVVDREEGGSKKLQDLGYQFTPLFTLQELGLK